MTRTFVGVAAALLTMTQRGRGCTNFIVTPGASMDGSTMLAYNSDDFPLLGQLYHYPSANNTEGNAPVMRKVYNWDDGEYLGEIPEKDETYNVMGNCNEYGVCIGETTFGGLKQLSEGQEDAKLDYGSLMYITLQRSKDAREAIKTMTSLTDQYGYLSEGETFSVVDKDEAWMMDMVSKGQGKLDAVWVAMRVPDGHITAHANQARITTFPRDDPDNCVYAEDVVDFARELGLFPQDADDANFSFADTYCPLPPYAVRYCAARVWSIFSPLAKNKNFSSKYLDHAMGWDMGNRMPLWIKPNKQLSLDDVRERMSSHYEGTELDFSNDVGAGIWNQPYRPRPHEKSQTWWLKENRYVNERAIAVEKTGMNFIAQSRGDMPRPLRGLMWFAVDDSSTSPRYPVYSCSTAASPAYSGQGPQDGVTSDILEFNMEKAFWVQNMVSNLVYSRWTDSYPVLKEKLDSIQDDFMTKVKATDKKAIQLYSDDPDKAIEHATQFSVQAGDELHKEWMNMYGYLFTRFRDFIIMEKDTENKACGCKPKLVGVDSSWKERIVEETGTHYQVPDMTQSEAEAVAKEVAMSLPMGEIMSDGAFRIVLSKTSRPNGEATGIMLMICCVAAFAFLAASTRQRQGYSPVLSVEGLESNPSQSIS